MKLLIYILLFYLAYRVFLRPMLNPPPHEGPIDLSEFDDEDNYIDYEEVE